MQLGYRLGEATQIDSRAEEWLQRGLQARGMALETIVQGEYARQSATNVTVGNIVRSLRRMGDINWLTWFEEVSRVDAILRAGSDFSQLDQATRAAYRSTIERIAQRSGHGEVEVAEAAVAAADTPEAVGAQLLGNPPPSFERCAGLCPRCASASAVVAAAGLVRRGRAGAGADGTAARGDGGGAAEGTPERWRSAAGVRAFAACRTALG